MKKRTKICIYSLALMGALLILTAGCKKKNNDDNSNTTPATITDIDGNVYHTLAIGTQLWLVENLKTNKFNDGTAIPLVQDSAGWMNLISPGFCWYNNDTSMHNNTFGALYNWYAVNTGKLAPAGWHIPTEAEWNVLTAYLGGSSVAGGKMKEAGTTNWIAPNTGATNSSGFTTLPAGFRYFDGSFADFYHYAYLWSTTESSSEVTFNCLSYYYENILQGSNDKRCGFSVRCLRN